MSLLFCPMPDIGCIAVEGRDAGSFLHAQLSQDVAALGPERAPLAGWHDARGRVRAIFRMLRTDEGFLLALPAELLAATLEQLQRFVLRAQVRLARAEGCSAAALIGGPLAAPAGALPLPAERDALAAMDGLRVVAAGPSLWHAFGSDAALEAYAAALPRGTPADAAAAAIRAGLPTIGTALAGRFVAQMLNLDALGAISFTKGCYPGQEIVARAHHLGTVKRRLRRFAAAGALAPAPGDEIVDDAGTAVGEVVAAARVGDGTELLAVVQNDARTRPLLLAGAALTEQPLPYEVP